MKRTKRKMKEFRVRALAAWDALADMPVRPEPEEIEVARALWSLATKRRAPEVRLHVAAKRLRDISWEFKDYPRHRILAAAGGKVIVPLERKEEVLKL